MRLRGRFDIAKDICKENDIGTSRPLVMVVSDDKLYCKYKVRLYTIELTRLKDLYLHCPTDSTKEDIQYFVKCTEGLCDFCIERGVKVDALYHLIDECLEVIRPVSYSSKS